MLVPFAWHVLTHNNFRKSKFKCAEIFFIIPTFLSYYNHNNLLQAFFFLACICVLKPAWLVKVQQPYVEPYCSSSASHRWRLEAFSGWLSPPVCMWWTLNYLADRSYLPPAPSRSLCQVLTSTSWQGTHHLAEQIFARAAQIAQATITRWSVNWNA